MTNQLLMFNDPTSINEAGMCLNIAKLCHNLVLIHAILKYLGEKCYEADKGPLRNTERVCEF